VRRQDIEDISLGHQQLLFDFEKDRQREQEITMSLLLEQTERNGYATLDGSVRYIGELQGLPDAVILQHIFGFAEGLRIHLLMANRIVEPHKARRALLDSPEESVLIIPNKPVDSLVFQDVKRLYRKLVEDKGPVDWDDQYEFSRCLVERTREWKRILESYQLAARGSLFPFGKETTDCLNLIGRVSAKLDSFSLISAFHGNKEEILRLSYEIKRISRFHSQHVNTWTNLIRTYEEVDDDLSGLRGDSIMEACFEDLKEALLSSTPYDKIPEAEASHARMTQRCREIVSAKIDNMIAEMRKHCDAYQASPELRNRSLYSLRRYKQHVGKATDITRMNLYLLDAEEGFYRILDELMMIQ